MKSKLFARILCIVLCLTIIGSILIIAIPMLTGKAAVVPVSGGSGHMRITSTCARAPARNTPSSPPWSKTQG